MNKLFFILAPSDTMGGYYSVNKVTDSSLEKLLVEQIISEGISLGYNKDGEKLFINNQLYKLVETKKIINRIEYIFENNISLVVEKMRETTKNGTAQLFYKLTQGRNVIMGEFVYPYKKMGFDCVNFDLIDQLQKIE